MNSIYRQVLFIQGGGSQEDYEADKYLVDSLQKHLGEAYKLHYPHLPNESVPDFGRIKQIGQEISRIQGEPIVVGHSLGASMLLKYVSQNEVKLPVKAIFLIATPFWSGDEEWKEGFKLPENFADRLSRDVPVFFYHSQDDEQVPIVHLTLYRQNLPWATFREIPTGGHQLTNDLTLVAKDIKSV